MDSDSSPPAYDSIVGGYSNGQPQPIVQQPRASVEEQTTHATGTNRLQSLQLLAGVQQLKIQRKNRNPGTKKYYIKADNENQDLYFGKEETSCCDPTVCIKIVDKTENEMIRLQHPIAEECTDCFSWSSSLCMNVYSPPDNLIGSVKQIVHTFSSDDYEVFDRGNKLAMKIIHTSGHSFGMLKHVDFKILSADQSEPLGYIGNDGFRLSNFLTGNAEIGIVFTVEQDLYIKALVLAACLLSVSLCICLPC